MSDRNDMVEEAVVASLVEVWDRQGVTAEPAGPRVFIRWADNRPGERGYDDWRLYGLVTGTAIEWLDDDPGYLGEIAAAVARGEASGRIEVLPLLTLWWCRSSGDGPHDPRVSDWAGPHTNEGDDE